ncbi:MAG: pyruvate carboxylase [Pirellulales bacterium]
MKPIRKLLVANRGEIAIRVFRTAHELGIRTVSVYSFEDRYALHRFKSDESYQIGHGGEPIRVYLDIDQIVEVALRHEVDAIHPGYGFLSENPDFAKACEKAGIIFVGPRVDILEQLGDKTAARELAKKAGVPVLGGTAKAVKDADEALQAAGKLGYPVILKASKGGGGRGMRVVKAAEELVPALEQATREAQTAFGCGDVFVEKLVQQARHIEVQLMGDKHGNLVHLYERDCSVQRRHQKVVELAPAPSLDPALREAICGAAVKIGKAVNYEAAGTVEFLVDAASGEYYFIEVNPRIQVEHTVTEQVTGVDIVKCQILVSQGMQLADPEINLAKQSDIRTHGFAIQCRVTTEDPGNKFLPDYGRIANYRSSAGMGIRLDAGTAFTGAVVTPFYDSLLVKVTAWGSRFVDASRRMERCLQEFRIRGVKTNLPFLINLVTHPVFLAGECTTKFIDETPDLFKFMERRDRATKLLSYLGDIAVNGNALVKGRPVAVRRAAAPVPKWSDTTTPPPGMRQKLIELGPQKFGQWVRQQQPLLLTDTTMRDAHQSLLATRMRTFDMLAISDVYARHCPQLFSLEMWGGATFDTSMRFLKECPWERLTALRERVPNILFQMLLRASNAVGYTSYPDNVVQAFVREAARAGIDVFRIFDSLNWVPNMRVAMEAACEAGAICEAAICYTGDILNPQREKYNLAYYVQMAKDLEKHGAHILAIKDMAGLCKPYAAERLVKALKQEIGIPIHFHTHDPAGGQVATLLKAAEAGVDIVDGAMAPLSGTTSQPCLNAVVEALRFTPRETGLNPARLRPIAHYWSAVRDFYTPFESGAKSADADVYLHEMPGGQSTNLFAQAQELGLADRWDEICRTYADVNQLFGDIVKVTPSSKAVGDMALFLVANNLTAQDVLDENRELACPKSVMDLIAGRMGQPPGGFPPEVCQRILRDQPQVSGRPGESLPPADFKAAEADLEKLLDRPVGEREVLSYLLYDRVFLDFANHQQKYSDTSVLSTPLFLYGMASGEESAIEIEPGKTLINRLLTVGDPQPSGERTVFFELNGQPREITVTDNALEPEAAARPKADPDDKLQIAAPMPGLVVTVAVEKGNKVAKGQKLLTLEAMKMETTLYAEQAGSVDEVHVKAGTQVNTGDLLLRMK